MPNFALQFDSRCPLIPSILYSCLCVLQSTWSGATGHYGSAMRLAVRDGPPGSVCARIAPITQILTAKQSVKARTPKNKHAIMDAAAMVRNSNESYNLCPLNNIAIPYNLFYGSCLTQQSTVFVIRL